MISNYIFSTEDMMDPVYCTGCHAHIPLAVSTIGNGKCLQCQLADKLNDARKYKRKWQHWQRINDALLKAADEIPFCPQCQCPSVQCRNYGWMGGLGGEEYFYLLFGPVVIGGGIRCWDGWKHTYPFIIVGTIMFCIGFLVIYVSNHGAFVKSKQKIWRKCPLCGNRWQA